METLSFKIENVNKEHCKTKEKIQDFVISLCKEFSLDRQDDLIFANIESTTNFICYQVCKSLCLSIMIDNDDCEVNIIVCLYDLKNEEIMKEIEYFSVKYFMEKQDESNI